MKFIVTFHICLHNSAFLLVEHIYSLKTYNKKRRKYIFRYKSTVKAILEYADESDATNKSLVETR